MKSAVDYTPTLSWGLLLIGQPKTGKTTTALQFPGKKYVADCDNNLQGPIRWLKENAPDRLAEIHYDTINMDENGREVEPELRWTRLLQCLNTALKDPEMKTIIIDSLTFLSDYIVDHIVAAKPNTKEKYMTISDWQPYRNMLSKLIISMRNMKRLLIVTAHEEKVKDDLDGSITIRANIPSKLADNIGGFFSDVWRTEAEEREGKLECTIRSLPTPRIPALGTGLGLPKVWKFTAAEFQKHLYKYDQTPNK